MANETPEPGWVYKPKDKAEASAQAQPSEPVTGQQYGGGTSVAKTSPQAEAPSEVSWTASEFIAHHKSAGWYFLVAIGILSISGIIFFFTRDLISSIVIGFAGLLFMILASHKPRELGYKVDPQGITIGSKFYPYDHFKSFGVIQEGAMSAINLLPLKRFMPEVSIYYPPDQEGKIVEIISEHLPHDQREEHGFDRLMKKIHF